MSSSVKTGNNVVAMPGVAARPLKVETADNRDKPRHRIIEEAAEANRAFWEDYPEGLVPASDFHEDERGYMRSPRGLLRHEEMVLSMHYQKARSAYKAIFGDREPTTKEEV